MRAAFWALLLSVAFSVLAFFLSLPLQWKDQAILGALLVASALLANRFFSTRVTTLFLSLSACFCTARYAWYRYSETWWSFKTLWSQIQPLDAAFVLLLLAAETYAFIILFLGCFQTSRPLKRLPVRLPSDPSQWPEVDVFIPTYNEPLEVVRPTVLAALTMDYPKDKFKVHILDDGRRSEFQDFATECGALYVTRFDNAHAKAGNINAALKKTSGEFVAIFDCDHVPTRSFLQMTLGGLVADPTMGMIQTPHHFYSPDPFERNLGIFRKVPNESALFYGIIQDGNDLWDATFFCGSCAVLRRTALEQIGGLAVETVTEDAHTALRMHAAGWSTCYLNLPQAAGLATSRLADHVGQRIRWARGMVQILRVDNPLFKKGLKLPQRICYLNSMLHYLFAAPRMIFLLSPLVYLVLGRSNVFGYLPGILAYGIPHILLSTVVNSRVHGKHRHSFWNEVYEMVLAPFILLPTTLALINPKWGKFNVTAKDSVVKGTHFDWHIGKAFVFLLLLNLIGIGMGLHRISLEGDPQGVITVNLVWVFFNTIMLGGAMAVANESKQVRSTVRVPAVLPVQVTLRSGETVAGQTGNLSMGGVVVRLVRSDVLDSGEVAEITIVNGSEEYTFPVVAAVASGSLIRFRFAPLSIDQEARLTRVTLGRADCWLSWRSEYEADRPLVNLFRIVIIAFKGFGAALLSLIPRSKSRKVRASRTAEQTATPIIALLLLLGSAGVANAQTPVAPVTASATPAVSSPAGPLDSAPAFRDVRSLGNLGHKQGSIMRGQSSRVALHFGVTMTRIVTEAAFTLRYRVSPRTAAGSRINVFLNGSPVGEVNVKGGDPYSGIAQAEIPLSPELFAVDNTLALEFHGVCTADCGDQSRNLWVEVDASSEVHTAGSLLPVPNRLKLLPAPFLAAGGQRLTEVPFVLDHHSDSFTKQAAGVVASWFGIQADSQPIRFSVTEGRFPQGNVVLLATRTSPLLEAIGVDPSVASVSIHNNPSDPYGKVLAIVAENGRKLIDAARAFSLQRYSTHGDSSILSISDLPSPRRPYDAPRWLDTTREVRLAQDMSDAQLHLKGSGSVHLYFRLPPDLYYGTRDTVPFHLRYRSSPLSKGSKAFAKLLLNGQVIATRPIPTDTATDIHEEIVYLPVAAIYPRNTLTVEFAFGSLSVGEDSPRVPEVTVLRTSELMVKGMPHFAAMPRLDMFANTGFPYTRLADLSETLVLLPAGAKADEISLYLTMVGFMGAQTGYPALRLELTQDSSRQERTNKDLLVIGSLNRQPLFRSWAAHMLLQPAGQQFGVGQKFGVDTLLSLLPGTEAARERRTVEVILQNDSQVDGVVQGFVSPVFPERSVIAFATLPGKSFDSLLEDWASAANASRLYGTVSLFTGGAFRSFTINPDRYQTGSLDPWSAMQYWARRYYWLSPLAIFACLWLMTSFCHKWLERRAAMRLGTQA
ncbi:MAG TPA: UDP-forming cellulose synthase catalytic subunit [Bryobacteraceae bacterium]|nr:UDP-forming cellulose synthase catalytic subunit [Bryobacteraceae bacterium]